MRAASRMVRRRFRLKGAHHGAVAPAPRRSCSRFCTSAGTASLSCRFEQAPDLGGVFFRQHRGLELLEGDDPSAPSQDESGVVDQAFRNSPSACGRGCAVDLALGVDSVLWSSSRARGCRERGIRRASCNEVLSSNRVVALERLVLAAQQRLHLLHDLFEVDGRTRVLSARVIRAGPAAPCASDSLRRHTR